MSKNSPEMKCLICKEIIGSEPINAIMFDSYGNYGSTIFDSNRNKIYLYIHDDCVKDNIELFGGLINKEKIIKDVEYVSAKDVLDIEE